MTATSSQHDHARRVLAAHADRVDAYLRDVVPTLAALDARSPDEAVAPVAYALAGSGKRLRPALVYEACGACGGGADVASPAAAAVELVHTFSLVHDDLPAMDDDDLRRGRPTVHRQFSEADAILAGDALAVAAFEVVARGLAHRPELAVAIVADLARATGPAGMIGGQALDIAGESRRLDLGQLRDLHSRKTAALLRCSCALGGRCAGADDATLRCLGDFGTKLGLAFQIADDVLDVTADTAALGKTAGKDAAAGKNTYPALLGLDASRRLARDTADDAIADLAELGPAADGLRALARFAVERDR